MDHPDSCFAQGWRHGSRVMLNEVKHLGASDLALTGAKMLR
jgi:hypothetical protein